MKLIRSLLCVILILLIVFADVSVYFADAASGSILVTDELSGNGRQVYSGDNFTEALAACVKGCVVSVTRRITLEEDAILRAEIALSGYSNIMFAGHKILLEENGAIVSETRMKMSEIEAIHSYSTVEMRREDVGFIYYLITQAPDFGDAKPVFASSGKLLGVAVDADKKVIYQDASVDGILSGDMLPLISMEAINTEKVTFSFEGTAYLDGRSYIANGCTMTAAATNMDYEGSVKRTYTIILLGDVNGNGFVDAADASLIARHVSGTSLLTGNALLAADADHDGEVNAADAELICQKYVRRDSYVSPL